MTYLLLANTKMTNLLLANTKMTNHEITNFLNNTTSEENISFFIGRYFHKNIKIDASPFGNMIRIKYCQDLKIFTQMLYAKNKWHCIACNNGNIARYNSVADFIFVLDIIAATSRNTKYRTNNQTITKILNEMKKKNILYFLIGRYFGKNLKIYSSQFGNIIKIEYCPKDNKRFGEMRYENDEWVCTQYNHETISEYKSIADFLLVLDMIV